MYNIVCLKNWMHYCSMLLYIFGFYIEYGYAGKEDNMEEYRFDGSACEFLEAMKYILIARQMYKDNRKDLLDVLTNPDKVEEVSDEYGMDDYVLIKELIRMTDELKDTGFYFKKSLVETLLQQMEEREKKKADGKNGT